MARKYTLRQRARKQEETRQRIVDATVELHGSLGPAQTSISAIAKQAGVQRATVYDHFPDEKSLLQACSSHYSKQHPPPDPTNWHKIQDPAERMRVALHEVYSYYHRVEPMMSLVYRDISLKPEVWETKAAQEQARLWEQIARTLLEPWGPKEETENLLEPAIRHALHFQTWHSLVHDQGLKNTQAVTLMVNLARCSASPRTDMLEEKPADLK